MQDRRPTTDRPPALRPVSQGDQGIEMAERPPSRLKNGFARQQSIYFQRPEKRVRKNIEGPIKQKKILLAFENKTNWCVQFRDQSRLRARQLNSTLCCFVTVMIIILLFSAAFFGMGRATIPAVEFPGFKLEKLKHPVFQTAYLDPATDSFYGDFSTTKKLKDEIQSFAQFARYTNYDQKTGRRFRRDGEIFDETIPSYDPSTDLTSPGNWISSQCYSNVTYKHSQSLIALVKQGTKLEKDLWTQIQAIMANMRAISTFNDEMARFFEKAGAALGGGDDKDAEDKPKEEEEVKEEEEKETNTFSAPKKLVNTGGGGAPNPHPVILEQLGEFKFEEFETEADLFAYVQQDGYGWDEDKPAVCFAFQVLENEQKNKYNLQVYFRDQWPMMYQVYPRLDQVTEQARSSNNIIAYAKQAYNGLNMFQVFAANSILQRRISPEAEIMLMTVPFKSKPFIVDSYLLLVLAFTSFFQFMFVLPVVIYTAYVLAREKETGFQQRLFENGLGRCSHFLSWLLQYTILNVILSLCYAAHIKRTVFAQDSFACIFVVIFLAMMSLFAFVWALRPLSNSPHTAMLITGFASFLSYYYSFASDQKQGVLDIDVKKQFALSPFTAIKNTIDTYGQFHANHYPMTFESWGTERFNWSLKLGANQFIVNFIFWMAVAIALECLILGFQYYKRTCLVRKVIFESSNRGTIEISGLQHRKEKQSPIYNLTIEKSQICCLIGTDSAQKTSLLEMMAGKRESRGKMVIKDSDFFARGKRPKLNEFLVYRSQDVILDDDLTAVDHLNLFAHLRGNQKYQNTHVVCDRLLPEKILVKQFSESQRQCLQTLIALSSENSRIVLLDEPTRGLGLAQRSELIKCLWRFKKDRYLIIQSSDAELVNVLADSVAKVLETGIESVNAREVDYNIASYKLIVEVLDGKPTDSLVRYLSKDVPDLTMEYHTELLTYYILPNISKQVLFNKTTFIENNMIMLGVIDFEIVSLPAFEVAQRNIALPIIPGEVADAFEDSFDEIDYAVKLVQKQGRNQEKATVEIQDPTEQEDCDAMSHDERYKRHPTSSQGREFDDGNRAVTPVQAAPLGIQEDPEMKEFLDMSKLPAKRPAYRRDFYYDFKKYKTKRQFGPLQCAAICRKNSKEHWHNKSRCLALFILPAMYVWLSWHSIRYYRHMSSGSLELTPDVLPFKQPLLVNSKTQVGNKDTSRWIDKIPMAAEAFEPKYIDTAGDKDYYGFENALFDFSTEEATQSPWAQGAYQFYEMDESRHKYKILSYANLTQPYSASLFPQFIIESVMKTALDDDDFEFKTTLKALPITKENLARGPYATFNDLKETLTLISMSDIVGQFGRMSWETVGCIAAAWFMLNAFTISQIIRERTSERKLFLESHGQSQFSYWMARYLNDLIFYLPVSLVAYYLIGTYEQQMEMAGRSVIVQPFAILPFIYVCSFMFKTELAGVLFLLCYQLTFQWLIPYLVLYVRLAAGMEIMGDFLFTKGKMLPMWSSISSMLFNSEVLKALGTYRENNTSGKGAPIEQDEKHAMNAPADVQWMLIQMIFFFFVLFVLIEWRLPCCLCDGMKRINEDDNLQFFEQQEEHDFEDAGESSEVAHILGEGQDLQLRFHLKSKPRKRLAFLLENYRLSKPRICCGLGFCCKRECLISDLSAQVQAGSKYAIVADGAHGKSTILKNLTDRKTAFVAAGIIKKQIGRQTPVYTTQSFDVLLNDLTLEDNINYFVRLGSVHPRLANQMVVAFGLYPSLHILVRNLNTSHKHLLMLVLALTGSNRTVILDEPFTGLTHDQTIKLVKIIRQKYDCTLIITAKSKAELELLQPESILTIRDQSQPLEEIEEASYLLTVRLKPRQVSSPPSQVNGDELMNLSSGSQLQQNSMSGEELHQFISQNFAVFEKLRGKKKSLVANVVSKLMVKARMTAEVSHEIGEMVHEDLELQSSSHEMALKCELIMSLFALIEALSKRFGQVHLEYRQDDYAVLRVVFDEDQRIKGVDDSYSDQNPAFSSVVEFVNQSDVVRTCTSNCYFMSSRNAIKPSKSSGSSFQVKNFIYSSQKGSLERMKSKAELQQQILWWAGLPTPKKNSSTTFGLNQNDLGGSRQESRQGGSRSGWGWPGQGGNSPMKSNMNMDVNADTLRHLTPKKRQLGGGSSRRSLD